MRKPSAKETAEIRLLYAQVDEKNIGSEMYSPEEAAQSRYGGDTFGTEIDGGPDCYVHGGLVRIN